MVESGAKLIHHQRNAWKTLPLLSLPECFEKLGDIPSGETAFALSDAARGLMLRPSAERLYVREL